MGQSYAGMRKVNAECVTCGWKQHGPQSQGSAARHVDANATHEVLVEILQYITYKDPSPELRARAKRRKD